MLTVFLFLDILEQCRNLRHQLMKEDEREHRLDDDEEEEVIGNVAKIKYNPLLFLVTSTKTNYKHKIF